MLDNLSNMIHFSNPVRRMIRNLIQNRLTIFVIMFENIWLFFYWSFHSFFVIIIWWIIVSILIILSSICWGHQLGSWPVKSPWYMSFLMSLVACKKSTHMTWGEMLTFDGRKGSPTGGYKTNYSGDAIRISDMGYFYEWDGTSKLRPSLVFLSILMLGA